MTKGDYSPQFYRAAQARLVLALQKIPLAKLDDYDQEFQRHMELIHETRKLLTYRQRLHAQEIIEHQGTAYERKHQNHGK